MEKELFVKWKIKASETQNILALLQELADKTRNEPGNIAYSIYQSESDPNELLLHERYTDEEAVELHKQSAHYQNIVVTKVIPNLEERIVTIIKKVL